MLEGDVTATHCRIPWRADLYAERAEQPIGYLDCKLCQRDGLGPDRLETGSLDERQHVLHSQHPDDRRGTTDEAPDAVRRRVVLGHCERLGRSHPALDRLAKPLLKIGTHIAEGGRTWPAIEVLVGAAD